MNDTKQPNERPEIYSLQQNSGNWQISRRNFLKAAGIGAAALGLAMNSHLVKPVSAEEDLIELCKSAPAHRNKITDLRASMDGKYLLSIDEEGKMKCWDFETQVLLGTADAPEGIREFDVVVPVDGASVAMKAESGQTLIGVNLPDLEAYAEKITITLGHYDKINSLAGSRDGNIYGAADRIIFRLTKGDDAPYYTEQDILFASLGTFKKVAAFDGDLTLLVIKDKGFGILDLETGKMKDLDKSGTWDAFAALPDGGSVLLFDNRGKESRLVSLTDGNVIWSQNLSGNISNAAITPDGGLAVLTGDSSEIELLSMADGSSVKTLNTGELSCKQIAVSADGTRCAVAVGQSILFINLPDFEVIGCPIDMGEVKDNYKGIEISGTDPVTGETVTYTLPCGAPIPAGAVCVCNCVTGRGGCAVDTCSCVGYKPGGCSCHSYNSRHYWYPN